MPETESGSRLVTSINDVRELEDFLYSLVPELARRKLRKDQDISPIVEELGLQVPECIRGSAITWPGAPRPIENDQEPGTVMVLARPAEGLGQGSYCLDIPIKNPPGVVRVCVECRFYLFCWITVRTIYPG